jgi:hypothetical protein
MEKKIQEMSIFKDFQEFSSQDSNGLIQKENRKKLLY